VFAWAEHVDDAIGKVAYIATNPALAFRGRIEKEA